MFFIDSSIKTSLLQKTLKRGSLVASIGAFILLFGGVFIPADTLKILGFPIFMLSFFLIAVGLVPYRKLRRLELNPNRIILEDNRYIQFCSQGKKKFSLPINSIESMKYVEKNNEYGIGIKLKTPIPEKIILYNSSFSIVSMQKKSQNRFDVDLFLPYFSKRSFERFQQEIASDIESRGDD